MTSMLHRTNGVTFASFAYAYNSVGHRTSRAETNNATGMTDTYTYDATDQVSGVNYNASQRVVSTRLVRLPTLL